MESMFNNTCPELSFIIRIFCYQEDAPSKVLAISSALASVLSSICTCTMTTEYISDGEFSCYEKGNGLVFQARLFSTSNTTVSSLMQYLADWIESKNAEIMVDNIHFMVDPTCKLEIDSFDDSQCEASTAGTSDQNSLSTISIVGPIVGVLLLALVVIAVVVVVLYAWKCHFRAKLQ